MKTFDIKRILVPVDFSETSLNALDHAVFMARAAGAGLVLIHVVEGLLATSDPDYFSFPRSLEYENDIMEQSKLRLKELGEKVNPDGKLDLRTMSVAGRTHREIVRACNETDSDIIIMGTHGVSGFVEYLAGSNTFRVVHTADCPVISIRNQFRTPGFKNILVPFHLLPDSRQGVRYALKVAEVCKSSLFLLGINFENDNDGREKVTLEAEQIKKIAGERGIRCETRIVSEAFSAKLILGHAKEVNADLIVEVTGMDRLSLPDYFTESFEKRLVNHSPVPVLSIRAIFNTDTVDMRFY